MGFVDLSDEENYYSAEQASDSLTIYCAARGSNDVTRPLFHEDVHRNLIAPTAIQLHFLPSTLDINFENTTRGRQFGRVKGNGFAEDRDHEIVLNRSCRQVRDEDT